MCSVGQEEDLIEAGMGGREAGERFGAGRGEIRQNTNEYKSRPREGNIGRKGRKDQLYRERKEGNQEGQGREDQLGRGRKGTRKAREEKIS